MPVDVVVLVDLEDAVVVLVLVLDVTVVVSSPLATTMKVSDSAIKLSLEVSFSVNR